MNKKLCLILFLTLNFLWGYKSQPLFVGMAAEAFAENGIKAQDKDQGKSEPEERSNPFLTVDEESALKSQPDAIPLNYLMVTAIFYSQANSRAIIDGEILKKGDFIDNKEIIGISPEEIFLKDNNSRYVLKMRNIFNGDQH